MSEQPIKLEGSVVQAELNKLDDKASREEQVIAALRTVYDPEIPLNLYDLGLIYKIDFASQNQVRIDMTLTTPHCPVAETMPGKVSSAVKEVQGIDEVDVRLVWDPPWTQDLINDEVKLALGIL